MDFLDPKKRKQHRIKLFVGYALMAVALGFITLVLWYLSDGYGYDTKTGEIVRNGFIFVDAYPEDADVYLNGESRGRSDLRLDQPTGEYRLELKSEGYRNWSREFFLEGGQIERYNYPFLFPTNLDVTDVQLYASNPGLISGSLDRRWVLVQQPGSLTNFDLVDVNADAPSASTIALPEGIINTAGSDHRLEVVEWSNDNRRLILKHASSAGVEFVLLDIESPGGSVNLTRSFNVTFSSIALRDKKYDQYYLHNEQTGDLYTARLTVPAAQLHQAGVIAFKSHGNDVLVFVTAASAPEGKVLVRVREDDQSYTVRQLPAGGQYLLDVARFENAWYFALGMTNESRVYILKNPVAAVRRESNRSPIPVVVLRTKVAPSFVSFSANTRFIALQAGNEFAVYDAEKNRQHRYDIEAGITTQKAIWMDGHRLSVVSGGKAVAFDFDGSNKQELHGAIDGFTPIFDRDYDAMYTLSTSAVVADRPALSRLDLRLDD